MIVDTLALGFGTALTLQNLGLCFIGVLLGTLIGVLPGLGTLATVAMLLPLTFGLPPVGALVMLAGIYYGSQYGGSTTAILVNIPGESSSVVTCLDGHAMALRGRAGSALALAALSSFAAGTFATLLIAFFGPLLASVAEQFSASEYFSLMVFGLVGAVVLARGSVLKATLMVVVGLILGCVGTDIQSGETRFTFDHPALMDGLPFTALAMGLFGIADVIMGAARVDKERSIAPIGSLRPSRPEIARAWPAAARGTAVGSLLGILPGGGALLSSFAAYALEKRLSRWPQEFGRGAAEGVAAPEAANNAGAQTSFIPMLTLGIPSNAVMALMIGAMTIHGIAPGPLVVTKQPELFWGLIVSMWVGNVMLLVINLPLIGLWVRLLRVPYDLLFPAIVLFCAIGVYSVSNASFDVALMALFALVGYLLWALGCEPAPLLLGFIIGPLLEENFRRAMLISRGDVLVMLNSPVSITILAAAATLLLSVVLPTVRKQREIAFSEDG
jgi:TctA family transporter